MSNVLVNFLPPVHPKHNTAFATDQYDDYRYQTDNGSESGQETTNGAKPRILLMGLQRSGKSSIQRVVFNKMPPNDTLYLESTTKIQKEDVTRSFIDFQVWDFPGQINFFETAYDSEEIFGAVGALIFVIDAQARKTFRFDNTTWGMNHRINEAIIILVNPKITFEVLIHKVDGLSDDYKIDTQRDIQQRTADALADAQMEHIQLSYYLTSIYDHSIYEAFSKIIQKLIRELPTLENLLNVLCSNSGIDKAYLFDTLTKIYIATDSSPVDMQSYEICSDMIDVIIDIECIYGAQNSASNGTTPSINDAEEDRSATLSSPSLSVGNGDANGFSGADSLQEQLMSDTSVASEPEAEASSLIKLTNGDVLYLREVNRLLVLICILRQESFEKHGLIDYNFQCFKEAITDVFEFSNTRNKLNSQLADGNNLVDNTAE
ncbi:hypothetical protein INT44_008792 [Umbelopsis vinacea]|uniref:GTP-binding protein n=1 Tax=Umbelopsis vinacea TaxID=44442 RepID=A0A8H7PGV1_9FUNG|nr:hypothetical protein INT44_008792 [Umbelopsis vinacea]